MEKRLIAIADKHFDVTSFQPRGKDSLDFRDVHVKSIQAALREAWEAGFGKGYDEGFDDGERAKRDK
jgi:hypothetical protein